jgi:hypothetical protein
MGMIMLGSLAAMLVLGLIRFPDWRTRTGVLSLAAIGAAGVVPIYGPSTVLGWLRPEPTAEKPAAAEPARPGAGKFLAWGVVLIIVGTIGGLGGGAFFDAAWLYLSGMAITALGCALALYSKGYHLAFSAVGGLFAALFPLLGPFICLWTERAGEKPQRKSTARAPARAVGFLSLLFYIFAASRLMALWPIERSTAMIHHSSHGWDGLIRKSNEGASRNNLGLMRAALTQYAARHDGRFPVELSELTGPGTAFLESFPRAKAPNYHADSSAVLLGTIPSDVSGWLYDSKAGGIFVNCTHTDTKGSVWSAY